MMKAIFKSWLTFFLIDIAVTYGWQVLEVIMIGKVNPNEVDGVVGFILTTSLYLNVMFMRTLYINKNNLKDGVI